jgi:hypothetical protein
VENTVSNRQKIYRCLDLPNKNLDVATGVAGRGISILHCSPWLDSETSQQWLQGIVDILLTAQQKDGSWLLPTVDSPKTNAKKTIGFANGISGITWFLLKYASSCLHSDIEDPAIKGLEWLSWRTHRLKDLFDSSAFNKIVFGRETGDERRGIILSFIKAYDVLKDERYKHLAESALSRYPDFSVNNDFSQDSGLAGMGELYLEAWRIFQNQEWRARAQRIAQVLLHTRFRQKEESCYWLMDETNKPTADLLIGNSGIVHFLIRCLHPAEGYLLLN